MDQRNLLKWDGGGELQEESLAWARAWKQSVGRVCAQGMPSPQPAWCVWSGGLTSQVEEGCVRCQGSPGLRVGTGRGRPRLPTGPKQLRLKNKTGF